MDKRIQVLIRLMYWCAPGPAVQVLTVFFCAVAGLRLAAQEAKGAGAASSKPNIVFILTDDLGAGDVRCFNPEGKIPTPCLDRLAGDGMMFTEAHSSSAVCTPSRYSILTGRYNWRSVLKRGVLGGFGPPLIEEGRLTVAELLRRQGYHTAAVGKWHLGLGWAKRTDKIADQTDPMGRTIDFSKPYGRGLTTLGFDEFFGISASLDMPPYTFLENDRVTVRPDHEGSFQWSGINGETKQTRVGPIAPGFDIAEVLPTLTQRAIQYIGERAAEARAGKPFFLYLPLNSPHTPLATAKEWQGRSGLNNYADFVMQTDAAIGEVLNALEEKGVAENTLVIFTSDNGCSPEADFPWLVSRGHDPSAGRRGYKADIYDGGHRIPLIVRWPGHVAAGSRSDAFVCLGDFMATCAELTGVRLPDNAGEDSISFRDVLEGRSLRGRRDTLVLHSINGSFGIRQGQWKLELCADSGGWSYPRPGRDRTEGMPRFQLFDLSADPAEKNNLVAGHPEVVERLGRLMRDFIVRGRSTPGPDQKNAPTSQWPQTAWLEQFGN